MRMKLRKNKKYSFFWLIVFLIVFLTFFLFNKYTKNIEPKLISIAKYDLDKYTNKAILNNLDTYIVDSNNLMNLLIINKNKDGEIISVDYDVEKVYLMLNEITSNVHNKFAYVDLDTFTNYEKSLSNSNNGFILSYPILLGSNNMFLNNLGPKIPIKVDVLSNILTNINTSIKDYGINSLLVEVYIVINIRHKIIALNVEDINFEYKFLLASKVINGSIPSYYGGVISKNSSIVS